MVRRIGRRVLNPSGHNPEPTRWISVAQAAGIVGLSERATRDWLRRYDVRTHGSRPLLVDEAELRRIVAEVRGSPGTAPEGPQMAQEPLEATYRLRDTSTPPSAALVPLSTLLGQTEAVTQRLTEMADKLAASQLEVGQLRERTANQERELARLRGELDAARKSPAAEAEGPQAPRKWWQRWR